MIERLWRGDISSSGPHAVTRVTAQTFSAIVLAVTEADTKGGSGLRRPPVRTWLMASTARRDVASICLRARCMTPVTVPVRAEPGWYRKRDSAAYRTMTTRAVHLPVTRVIESHAEACKAWKRLYLSRLRIRMTDRAHWTTGVCKLLRVTTGARRMLIGSRHRRPRARLPSMTKQAWQTGMVRVVVFEPRIILRSRGP